MGINDEVDAASGARGDWRRDPDGDDGNVGDVIGTIGLKAKHHFTFRKHLLGPLELVFQDSAVDLLLKRLRQATAA